MSRFVCLLGLLFLQSASGALFLKKAKSCTQEDLKHRAALQNKLAGVCVDMCKEVGAFPKCTCPDFVAPDSTPGVMTWPELLEHMDNLSEWGHGELKAWTKQASSALQKSQQAMTIDEEGCLAEDANVRRQVQNKLAGVCVDMCKEVGAYPKCTCPDFVQPDSTPGVMTWPELLEHMDNLSEWGHGELKAWTTQASLLQKSRKDIFDSLEDTEELDEDDAKVVRGETEESDEQDQSEIDADAESQGAEEEDSEAAEEQDKAEDSDDEAENEDGEEALIQTRKKDDSETDLEDLDEDDAKVVRGETDTDMDEENESEIDADAEADSADESTEDVGDDDEKDENGESESEDEQNENESDEDADEDDE